MEPIFFSVVILLSNRDHFLSSTLDTLKVQLEKNFEVVLAGGDEKLRLKELASQYPELKISFQRAKTLSEPELMNAGIEAARGKYVQFLHPGDRLISQHALSHVKELIEAAKEPQLAYGGFLSQTIDGPPEILSIPLCADNLRKGIFPTLIRGTWFLKKTLVDLGGFNPKLSYRPVFDILCRLFEKGNIATACSQHVLTDGEPQRKTSKELIGSGLETLQILYRRFGLFAALRWIFSQDLSHVLRRFSFFLKQAFVKGRQ